MFEIILTLDYELPAGGRGDVRQLMVEPTAQLMEICEQYEVKLTIMLEIGELWAFENPANRGFREHLGYDAVAKIRNQLVQAIKRGHDVQLHLHPQWLGARWKQGVWHLDYSKYRLPGLDYHEMVDAFRKGKEYLEGLLRPHIDEYSCIGFRAGNWITQPSGNYLRALNEAGLKSDTSVFKWGYLNTSSVYMDYRRAHSNVLPWVACWTDINRPGKDGGILEFPIYAELVSLFGMVSVKRIFLARKYLLEDRAIANAVQSSISKLRRPFSSFWHKISQVFRKYPKKFDFCKLTTREMLRMIENIHHRYGEDQVVTHVPIVMIGHSKEVGDCHDFNFFLEQAFRRFGHRLRSSTYREIIKALSDDYYQSINH
jgi:hypothetical protein